MPDLDLLQAMIADLDGYIARKAHEIAAPVMAAADQSVRDARAETDGAIQRGDDVAREIRRRIRVLERDRARSGARLELIRDYATSLPEVRQAGYGLGRVRDDLLAILDRAEGEQR